MVLKFEDFIKESMNVHPNGNIIKHYFGCTPQELYNWIDDEGNMPKDVNVDYSLIKDGSFDELANLVNNEMDEDDRICLVSTINLFKGNTTAVAQAIINAYSEGSFGNLMNLLDEHQNMLNPQSELYTDSGDGSELIYPVLLYIKENYCN